MTSTLDGSYEPKVGDHVWQQMYSPSKPHPGATIEERVAGGVTYGKRRRMILVAIHPDRDTTEYARSLGMDVPERHATGWLLQAEDPKDRTGEFPFSSVDSDWCVLEPIEDAEWQEALL